MKAILMTAAGSADVLQLREIAKPELPSPHHLRVKLAAAGVNPLDTKLRQACLLPDRLPAILGCDGAGIVEQTGSAVTRFKAGDEVFFCNGGLGGICLTSPAATPNTPHCTKNTARQNPPISACRTAPHCISVDYRMGSTDRTRQPAIRTDYLIHAAAGGVGHIAVQLAHHLDADIAVTVSDARKAGLVHGLYAEKIINYREQDFVEQTLNWTEGNGVDVVFDTVGGETFLRSLNAVRIGGKLVSLLSTPLSLADTQLARLRNLSLCYELMLTPQVMKQHDERIRQRKILEQGTKLVEEGHLGVLVTHKLPLEQQRKRTA